MCMVIFLLLASCTRRCCSVPCSSPSSVSFIAPVVHVTFSGLTDWQIMQQDAPYRYLAFTHTKTPSPSYRPRIFPLRRPLLTHHSRPRPPLHTLLHMPSEPHTRLHMPLATNQPIVSSPVSSVSRSNLCSLEKGVFL